VVRADVAGKSAANCALSGGCRLLVGALTWTRSSALHTVDNMSETRILELRTQRRWTQERLAEISGVTVRTVQRLEAGNDVSLDTPSRLGTALGVPVRDLFMEAPKSEYGKAMSALYAAFAIRPEADRLTGGHGLVANGAVGESGHAKESRATGDRVDGGGRVQAGARTGEDRHDDRRRSPSRRALALSRQPRKTTRVPRT